MRIYILVIIWWLGAIAAGLALFFPAYQVYFAVGIAGWITIAASSGLIIYEIKRTKAEDRKKSKLAGEG